MSGQKARGVLAAKSYKMDREFSEAGNKLAGLFRIHELGLAPQLMQEFDLDADSSKASYKNGKLELKSEKRLAI